MKVNPQFVPQIYRRTVPITQSKDGSLGIGGEGIPVEFARVVFIALMLMSPAVALAGPAADANAVVDRWSGLLADQRIF
jgi:hypothetical protein